MNDLSGNILTTLPAVVSGPCAETLCKCRVKGSLGTKLFILYCTNKENLLIL